MQVKQTFKSPRTKIILVYIELQSIEVEFITTEK